MNSNCFFLPFAPYGLPLLASFEKLHFGRSALPKIGHILN
jgi:hypothetical protein